ncbi:unnamed protein product [Adineta steineri]|uniref:EamA domain-containing protein n=1 Tax=Adineta steineri TaxID=433720 RepID=A0A814ZJL9_9BILA|nr:unnamed protein product [Adineta steineri]
MYVFVCQTTSLVLLLRYSKTVNSEKYLSSTAVVTAEFLKGIVCIFLVWLENDRSINRVILVINEEIYNKPHDTMRLARLSGLYAIQNNLLFIALSYLNTATYQVTYQSKILTTALFSVFILNKKIEKRQWFSLFMLAIGVALVTWPTSDESNKRLTAQNQATWLQQMMGYLNTATYQVTYQSKILTTALFSVFILNKKIEKRQWFSLFMLAIGVALVTWPTSDESNKRLTAQNQATWLQQMMGFCAVLVSAVTSGFAGVYFEQILKTGPTSVWVRNIQLAIFGTIFGLLIVFCFDYKAIMDKGFFQGYTTIVWIVIFLQAIGGLIIAIVIKYADSIIKGFATSLSILLSSVISFFVLHDFTPILFFYIGTMCVLTATFLYGWKRKPKVTSSVNDQPCI